MDDRSASGALLQTVQRDVAEIHTREIRRDRDSKKLRQPHQFDRSRARRESRRPDLHESSIALSRRDILSGWISAGRLSVDSASSAQSELRRALCSVRDCRRRIALPVRLSSGWFFTAEKDCARMKRFIPAIVFGFALLWIAASFRPPESTSEDVDLAKFGKIPVLVGGRGKPLDTVARNSLLIIHGKQTLRLANEKQLSPMQWLSDTLFNGPVADQYPVFVIQNAEVLGLFGWEQSDRKYFSFADLTPFLKQIDEQGGQSEKLESVQRSAYQNAILNLRNALVLYQRLKNSVQPEDTQNFAGELEAFQTSVPDAARAARQRETGQNFDKPKLDDVAELIQRYEKLSEMAYMLVVPPMNPPGSAIPATANEEWRSIGDSLLRSVGTGEIHPIVKDYALIGDAYRTGDRAAFNQHVDLLADWIAKEQPTAAKRTSFEFLFNHVDPFTHSMVLYVLAFLLACGSWL